MAKYTDHTAGIKMMTLLMVLLCLGVVRKQGCCSNQRENIKCLNCYLHENFLKSVPSIINEVWLNTSCPNLTAAKQKVSLKRNWPTCHGCCQRLMLSESILKLGRCCDQKRFWLAVVEQIRTQEAEGFQAGTLEIIKHQLFFSWRQKK